MQIQLLQDLLPSTGIQHLLQPALHAFLKPVQLRRNIWSVHHILYSDCATICASTLLRVRKVVVSCGGKHISSRLPISCSTPNVCLVILEPTRTTAFTAFAASLHEFLHYQRPSTHTEILPLTNKQINADDRVFEKNVDWLLPHTLVPHCDPPPPFLHHVVHSFVKTYGIPARNRRKRNVLNFHNGYKHLHHQ